MSDEPLVQITIRGANLAIIGGRAFAALIPPPSAATWIVTGAKDGAIQFTDQASGQVLSVPDTDIGTQAVVAPADSGAAATSWIVTRFSDDEGDDATVITDPSQLDSGYYTLQEPRTGEFLARNYIEDRSLLPKRVALQNRDDPSQYELVIRVVG